MSLRVLAGKYKGRVLHPPKTKELRPTQTSLRESFFNMIQWEIQEAIFLDLFAGSGVMGIEALSRGAAAAYFIEKDRVAMRAIKNAFTHFAIEEEAHFLTLPVEKALPLLKKQERKFSLVFLDPPYAWKKEAKEKLLLQIYNLKILDAEGKIFLEESSKESFDYTLQGMFKQSQRRFGSSSLIKLEM